MISEPSVARAPPATRDLPRTWRLGRIALLSALVLFVEMLLIRWIGTEIRVFAYLQNAILVASFLGLGLGCWAAREKARLLPAVVALVAIALFIRDPAGWQLSTALTLGLTAFQDSVIWAAHFGGQDPTTSRAVRSALIALAIAATLGVLWAVATVFHPLGQWLARWMDAEDRPIPAYSANILGSIVGIVVFDVLTIRLLPPGAWIFVACLGLASLVTVAEDRRRALGVAVALLLACVALTWRGEAATIWSPYQKLSLRPWQAFSGLTGSQETCGQQIVVNGVRFQGIVDLDPRDPALGRPLTPPSVVRTSHYLLPYQLIQKPERVLVAGAGTGNDVAAALRNGARSVVAVEIDPLIVDWGGSHHPNRPYASPQVDVVIDDARAFFRRATGPFDLVWLGFLDSHTTPSAYTNVRLDHFVYTRESFQDIKRLLSPSGIVALYFWNETPWIGDRLAGLLTDTFGRKPLSLWVRDTDPCLGHGGLLLIGGAKAAVDEVERRATADPDIAALALPNPWPLKAERPTDDWPYLYLRHREVPAYHLIVAAACIGLAFVLRRRVTGKEGHLNWAMALLGAGFMLLEVLGVSRAALLYGTTWTVNAYVVGAILTMILVANLVGSRFKVNPTGLPFAGLAVCILVLAFLPTASLAALPLASRIVVGGFVLALPVFFSGLVFIGAWVRVDRRDLALGSNNLGALGGGVASMLTMLVGFQQLMLLTLAVYFGAFLVMRSRKAAPA